MKISVEVRDGECWELWINGLLRTHGVGGGVEDRDQLMERMREWEGELRRMHVIRGAVERARTIINMEDHVDNTPEKKRLAYAKGLLSGILGELREHPMPGVPQIPPPGGRAFQEGFEWGLALRQSAKVDGV